MNDFVISVNSSKFNLEIIDKNQLNFNQENINYELIHLSANNYLLKLNNKQYNLVAEKENSDFFNVLVDGYHYEVTVRTALQEKAFKLLESSSGKQRHHTDVKAPMPGLILKIRKNVGDKVEQGESVIILEAMKMENDLKAPASGQIKKIFVTEGSAVEKGSALFSIE
jgi:biotin carboxyl carrier protein